jgi:phage-related protein
LISTDFSFDGRDCSEFGLYVVRDSNGLITTPYTSSKNILEDHPKTVLTPYYYGVQHQPLSFTVTFAMVDNGEFDSDKLYEIGNWLFQDKYKPFISADNLGKIFYCMGINQVNFMNTGLRDGMITVDFRCRDAFGWTPQTHYVFDMSDNVGATPTSIQIENMSNIGVEYYYPIIEFTLQSTETAISIVNNSDGGRTFSFTGLDTGEVVYIDNRKQIITSDSGEYRFDEWNKVWFRLVKGVNNITIAGKCVVTFIAQYPIIC